MLRLTVALMLSLFAQPCAGQIAVDGTLVGDEADYGSARSVQNTNTGYGNAMNGDSRYANGGSEIDQVFARILENRLYVLVTGNLESNFNKLSVFIDSAPGGVNQVVGSNLPSLVDPYCCEGIGALQRFNNLRFDTGFQADHFLTFSNGEHDFGSVEDLWTLSAYYADLTQGTSGNKSEIGFQRNASGVEPGLGMGEPIDQLNNGCAGPSDTNCMPPEHEFAEPTDTENDPTNSRGHRDFLNDVGLLMAINNSNTQGVNFGSGAATGNPASVLTGIEFSLPLFVLGDPAGDIKIAAFIGSGNHGNVSNQVAGTGVLRSNLGSSASVNFASIAGDQYVTVPVPTADFDGDGDIDGQDFLVWQRGESPSPLGANDLALWQEQYASAGPLAASLIVPEPSSVILLLFILAAGGSQRFITLSR
jgi:hypothetical protein